MPLRLGVTNKTKKKSMKEKDVRGGARDNIFDLSADSI